MKIDYDPGPMTLTPGISSIIPFTLAILVRNTNAVASNICFALFGVLILVTIIWTAIEVVKAN